MDKTSSDFMIKTLVVGQMATNCYIVEDLETNETIVIDPGDDAEYISGMLTELNANPITIIATHGHFDHIMGAYALQLMYNIPFVMHKSDVFLLQAMRSSAMHFLHLPHVDPPPRISRFTDDKETLPIGKQKLTVIHTPGHTPGSICLKLDDILFVGDTIFAGGAVGRTDFSYSEPLKLAQSINSIRSFRKGTRMLAGHGEEFTL